MEAAPLGVLGLEDGALLVLTSVSQAKAWEPAIHKQEGGGEGQQGCEQGGNANKDQKYDLRKADMGRSSVKEEKSR